MSEPNLLKITPQRRTRRKLMPSLLKVKHTQWSTLSESTQLNDSFSKELHPVVYLPEHCKNSQDLSPSLTGASSQSANVMNDNSLRALCRVSSQQNGVSRGSALYIYSAR